MSSNKKWGTKKVLITVLVIIVAVEIVALLWLKLTVNNYKNFWAEKYKESGEITYLALGDSAAQGIGATSPMRGYVGLIAKRVEEKTGKSVKVINVSKTGATIKDYLNDQAIYAKETKADLVTIEIGANDISDFDDDTFRNEFKQVLRTLPDGSFVSNMPKFNSRPGSTNNAEQASKIIAEEIKAYPNLVLVDLQKYTSENQSIFGFAPDFFHPNNLSYKNWANAFWHQIQKQEL